MERGCGCKVVSPLCCHFRRCWLLVIEEGAVIEHSEMKEKWPNWENKTKEGENPEPFIFNLNDAKV